jgi:hypothetical protein
MKAYFLLLIYFLLLSNFSKAQFSPSFEDAGMWNTLSVDYAISKKTALLFTEELRLNENYTRLNLLYTNIGVEHNINKHFKTSLVYRFINKYNEDNFFEFRHRLMWDITAKQKISRFTLAYRHRLQVEYRNIMTSETGFVPEWYSRHKVDISYQLSKKATPYVSAETRYQLYDPRRVISQDKLHRIRFQAGLDYKLNKFSKVGVYYLVQRVFNVANIENIYITGLEYSISLKDSPLFKKKKKSSKN